MRLFFYSRAILNIQAKHYFTTMGYLGVLLLGSLYLNSIFATPIYEDGVLKSVDYTPNFFFTYIPPMDIALTETWHWYLYLGVLSVLAIVLIGVFYIPYFVRTGREQRL